MGFVVSFPEVTPSPRFDGRSWTKLRIEASTDSQGPWTLDETQTLPEPDPNPQEPKTRNITSSAGSLEAGYYRLVFVDEAGAQDVPRIFLWPPVEPSQTVVPTVSEMWARSPLLTARYPSPGGKPSLEQFRAESQAILSSLTGRNIGIVGAEAPPVLEEEGGFEPWYGIVQGSGGGQEFLRSLAPVPGRLTGVARRAVILKAERVALGSTVRSRMEAANSSLIKSFSAGAYSESRNVVGELRAKMQFDPDPELDECIRLLMTEEAFGVFLYVATGKQLPEGLATAFDMTKVPGSYESLLSDVFFSLY